MKGSKLQKQCLETLTNLGWLTIRFNSITRGKLKCYIIWNIMKSAGFPDIACFKNNRFHFIEIKGDGDNERPSQTVFRKLCERTGNDYHIVESITDLLTILRGEYAEQ